MPLFYHPGLNPTDQMEIMKRGILIALLFACFGAAAQDITIVSPNGGESLGGCTVHNISWTETGTTNFYDIDYSPNNGVTWVSVATAINTTSGTYAWTVPNISSSQFKIRVTDSGQPAVNDESDAVFTVNAALTLNSPNGGEATVANAVMPVTFSANGTSGNYKLEYSDDAGFTWNTISNNQSIPSASYNWNVPNVNTVQAQFRITDVADACATDKSDSVFSIASVIDVTQPNGGEVCQAQVRQIPGGVSQDVIVNSDRIEHVYSGRVFDNGGTGNYSANRDDIVTLMPAVIGAPVRLNFTMFDTRESADYLRIYNGPTTSDPILGTWSNSSSPGTITSTHETGALTLKWHTDNDSYIDPGFQADISLVNLYATEFKEITWNRTGTSGTFHIEYSVDNGAGWKRIVSNYTDASGVYKWHVPNDPSTLALVRVIDAGNGTIIDQSDAVFTIGQATPKLYTPNGGEKLIAGLTQEITWEDGLFAGSAVVLEYSVDDGSSWNLIHSGTANDGAYTWTLPNVSTEVGRVRISEFGNTSFFDVSDTTFRMATYVQFETPNGGESYNGCDITSVQWCAGATSGNYDLDYSTDGGATWTNIVTDHALSGALVTFNWAMVNVTSSTVRLRVSHL